MKTFAIFPAVILALSFLSCSNDDSDNGSDSDPIIENPNPSNTIVKYLALGDSYTIGESVCATCRFPAQLKDSLEHELPETDVTLKVIAQTGWTTTNLISAINNEDLANDYDLVTLLIGVNNQYQNKPFSLYESEFPQLLTTAVALAGGIKSNVIVVSIPDYAYTPFGQNSSNPNNISSQIDQYNNFAQQYCEMNGIEFVNITDITRDGLNNPALVANDGLHPSETAYTKFVERILPKAIIAVE